MAVTTPTGEARIDLTPETGHAPLEVTAHLRTGVGFDPPYGLDLAGILATRQRRIQQAALDSAGTLATRPLPDTTEDEALDLTLPVTRCTTAGADWHWAATCAIPNAAAEHPEPRTFYRVVDSRWAQHAAARPLPYFHPKAGAYRDVMMPAPVVVCPSVTWRAVGDPEQIERLLAPIRFLGRRRAAGEGGVLAWTVHRRDDVADVGRWIHVDGDDRLLRPVPTACAERLEVAHTTGWYALRPPSWHPDRLQELAMSDTNLEDEW